MPSADQRSVNRLGAVLWAGYYFLLYKPKKEAAEELTVQNRNKRTEIMSELANLDVA